MTDNEKIESLALEVANLKRALSGLRKAELERAWCEQVAHECSKPGATMLGLVQRFIDERAKAHADGYADGYMARLAESEGTKP